MSDERRYIVMTDKPRILKHGAGWMCVGLQRSSPRWWFRRQSVVTRYGVSPQHAFNFWHLAMNVQT